MDNGLLIIIHALLGFLALGSVLVIGVRKKKDLIHKLLGYFFVITSIGGAIAGSVIASTYGSLFFINIAIATIGQILLGLTALKNRKMQFTSTEKVLVGLFVLNSFIFFIYGIGVTTALGLLYLTIGIYQLWVYSPYKEKTRFLWLSQHIGHMFGASISIVTAFIVGNLGAYSMVGFLWVVPALLGIGVVRYFRKTYAPSREIKIGKFKW